MLHLWTSPYFAIDSVTRSTIRKLTFPSSFMAFASARHLVLEFRHNVASREISRRPETEHPIETRKKMCQILIQKFVNILRLSRSNSIRDVLEKI